MKRKGYGCVRNILLAGCFLLLCGCSVQKDDMKKIRDIDFTVVDEYRLPKELGQYIEEIKKEPFAITYGEEGYLYIAKGYGTKETGGYSIEVEECFETSNLICVRTKLIGPSEDEALEGKETYPVIVLKIEYSDKSVVFE